MVAAIAVVTPKAVPSLEGVLQSIQDATQLLFLDAAQAVNALSPSDDAPLEPPAEYRIAAAAYPMPQDWPALVLGGSNLRRRPGADNATRGGFWTGDVQLHAWLQDDDPDRLARSLHRYAAVLWVVTTSAEMQRAFGGALLLPETLAIGPSTDPAQSLAQQSIIVRFSVTLRA